MSRVHCPHHHGGVAVAVIAALALASLVLSAGASAADSDPLSEWQLVPSVGGNDDVFGQKVATDGTHVIVGAPGADVPYPSAGAAFLYAHDGDGWTETAVLAPEDRPARSFFGSAVAVDGGLAAIGAYAHGGTGAVYVFERNGTAWDNTHRIRRARPGRGDEFGYGVAIADGAIFVGSPRVNSSGLGSGAVFVFERAGSWWSETAMLVASDAMPGDGFGLSLAVHRSWLAVGAPGRLDSSLGYVYLFERTPAGWVQRQRLSPSLGGSGARRFGAAIAIDDQRVLVGAYVLAGGVYFFRRDGDLWTEESRVFGSDTDAGVLFGQSVALNGSIAAVGALGGDGRAPDSGMVSLYRLGDDGWRFAQAITSTDGVTGDGFGGALAAGGDYIVVGAALAMRGRRATGAAYIYALAGE